MARELQERDPQPPDRDRALRRRGPPAWAAPSRDPLSGRTYVYQAMRVTGAADPTVSVKDTMKGKLPQKKLVREAAHGYSSYGNQIGLATGAVKEIYHPGYVAKRMEIGAVLGAAPRRAVIRENSDPGDIIVLLGGRTGRDGWRRRDRILQGAHRGVPSRHAAAEVQKGNPPTERKIQRLFPQGGSEPPHQEVQ